MKLFLRQYHRKWRRHNKYFSLILIAICPLVTIGQIDTTYIFDGTINQTIDYGPGSTFLQKKFYQSGELKSLCEVKIEIETNYNYVEQENGTFTCEARKAFVTVLNGNCTFFSLDGKVEKKENWKNGKLETK